MKIKRVYTGQGGETHLGEVELPSDTSRPGSEMSKPMPATQIEISIGTQGRSPSGDNTYKWHNPPKRLLAITLQGTHEVEVSDGSKHLCEPGDLLIFEDTTGKGHISRMITDPPHKIVFVMLE